MKRKCVSATLVCLIFGIGYLAFSAPAPRLSIELKSRSKGKLHSATVDLKIENPTQSAVWLVLSHSSNEDLPSDGKFQSGKATKDAFEASQYDEGKGSGIIVNHYGTNPFQAIYVPALGAVNFKQFILQDGKFIHSHDFLVATKLLVNGKTPLEKWLPYNVRSSTNTTVKGRLFSGEQKILTWWHENSQNPKPYPRENVSFVTATGVLLRRTVKFEEEENKSIKSDKK